MIALISLVLTTILAFYFHLPPYPWSPPSEDGHTIHFTVMELRLRDGAPWAHPTDAQTQVHLSVVSLPFKAVLIRDQIYFSYSFFLTFPLIDKIQIKLAFCYSSDIVIENRDNVFVKRILDIVRQWCLLLKHETQENIFCNAAIRLPYGHSDLNGSCVWVGASQCKKRWWLPPHPPPVCLD